MGITKNALSHKLMVWNSGASRSRLTILRHADQLQAEPMKIRGTRFISFGRMPANELRDATNQASWNTLDDEFEGGFSSSLWQKLRQGVELETAVQVPTGKLIVQVFGENNDRVTLISHADSDQFDPVRIGKTSIVALNSAAHAEFGRMVQSIKKAELMDLLSTGSSTANRVRAELIK